MQCAQAKGRQGAQQRVAGWERRGPLKVRRARGGSQFHAEFCKLQTCTDARPGDLTQRIVKSTWVSSSHAATVNSGGDQSRITGILYRAAKLDAMGIAAHHLGVGPRRQLGG